MSSEVDNAKLVRLNLFWPWAVPSPLGHGQLPTAPIQTQMSAPICERQMKNTASAL